MYKINRERNEITMLEQKSFSELGFKERKHLQEWIAKKPSALGEELLIIQKEFSGFADTKERLDLLAIDKKGSLVIIENKLDDSGRDVTWQAQKYASYCSGLLTSNIKDIFQKYLNDTQSDDSAEQALSEFFGEDYEEINLNNTQRIILVAAKFKKEVTSTVLWLLNYQVDIKCLKATVYAKEDELLLNLEQIIPIKDAEEYMIGIAEKSQDDNNRQTKRRHAIRVEFWTKLLHEMNSKSKLFKNISPGKGGDIGKSAGVPGLSYIFVSAKSYCSAELYIDTGDKEQNKDAFGQLHKLKKKIEEDFGGELLWQRLDEKRGSRIQAKLDGNMLDKDQWQTMISSMVHNMLQLEQALRTPLKQITLN